LIEGGWIKREFDTRICEKRFRFRGEEQHVLVAVDVQRLDSDVIPRQQQRPVPAVPQREREHPAQPRQHTGLFLLVKVQEDFGVAGGSEAVTFRGKPVANLAVIVDLTVEDDV
jgi:hypothetical protein